MAPVFPKSPEIAGGHSHLIADLAKPRVVALRLKTKAAAFAIALSLSIIPSIILLPFSWRRPIDQAIEAAIFAVVSVVVIAMIWKAIIYARRNLDLLRSGECAIATLATRRHVRGKHGGVRLLASFQTIRVGWCVEIAKTSPCKTAQTCRSWSFATRINLQGMLRLAAAAGQCSPTTDIFWNGS